MELASLIKTAYKRNGVITAYVYGSFGAGKTSYALWTAYEVLGSWRSVLDYLFFSPRDAVKKIGEAIESGKRLKIIIMDDAGLWLDKLTWWEHDKVAFMEFFNLIRSVSAAVIFTTPSEELPKAILDKAYFRVSVEPVSRDYIVGTFGKDLYRALVKIAEEHGVEPYFSIATGYRLKMLPSFFKLVKKEFYDIYPTHYPQDVYTKYKEKRRKALTEAFRKWKKKLESEETNGSRDAMLLMIKDLLKEGRSAKEVVEELMRKGIPRSTAYRWVKKVREIMLVAN